MPQTTSSASAPPSASGPRTSHRKSGAPSSRSALSRFGTVQTRSARGRAGVSPVRAVTVDTLRARSPIAVRGVADLADQLLDHVLERGHPDGPTAQVDDLRHVGALALEGLQSVVQRVVRVDRREGPDPLVLDRALAALGVRLQDVLDVEVADQVAAVPLGDREA